MLLKKIGPKTFWKFAVGT